MKVDPDDGRSHFKIVYWGVGLAGKQTTLCRIYESSDPTTRSALKSQATEKERMLFFDLDFDDPLFERVDRDREPTKKPADRLHLYTIPGTVLYDASRSKILRGVDAIVCVVDSARFCIDGSVAMLELLATTLGETGITHDVPLVFQYNKRDLVDHAMPVRDLDARLNLRNHPAFESIATQGLGVIETLRAAAALITRK